MREHPILMQGPLVRATLEGRKTQTRRPVKPWLGRNPPLWSRLLNQDGKPDFDWGELLYYGQDEDSLRHGFGFDDSGHGDTENDAWLASPMGQAGDRLWVRETFAIVHPCRDCEAGYVDDIKQPSVIPKDNAGGYWVPWYRSDWKGDDDTERGFQWTPSIHMPRWASRIVLPLMSIRVERVQDITEEDAKAEGVEPVVMRGIGSYPEWMRPTMREVGGHQKAFELLWKQIYGEASWDANPWVWVAEWEDIEVSR